jgi:hypothetical protein
MSFAPVFVVFTATNAMEPCGRSLPPVLACCSCPSVGPWRSWERASMASRRSWVRIPSAPPTYLFLLKFPFKSITKTLRTLSDFRSQHHAHDFSVRLAFAGAHSFSVNIHHRAEVGMPHKFPLHFHRSARFIQKRPECVPERMPANGPIPQRMPSG